MDKLKKYRSRASCASNSRRDSKRALSELLSKFAAIGACIVCAAFTASCTDPSNGPRINTEFNGLSPMKVETLGFSEPIDEFYAGYAVPDQPGCAVGVLRDGRYLHAKGYGTANLDYSVAITPDSVFRSGSLAKQFTAHAIALLALRKQLDLDADIHAYLPDLAEYGETVTARQMIHHISGMGDYGFDPQRFQLAPGKPFRFGNQDYWTPDEFFQAAAVQPLVAPPGQTYLYSNLAYFFLGQVVQKVSGMTLREFAQLEFFAPLSMNDTFFNDNINDVVTRRATGYLMTDNGRFEVFETNNGWVGNGGLYTSLNDLAKWDRAFIAGNVPGGSEAVKILTTPHPVTLGTMQSSVLDEGAGYGYGLQLGTYNGYEMQAHGGAWVGYRALYARFSQTRLSVIILCNRHDGRSRASIQRLLDHSLAWVNR